MDRDTLFRLYAVEKKTLAEIAGPLGLSASAVHKRLQRAGIPTRTPLEARQLAKPKRPYTPEELEKKRRVAAENRKKITPASREKARSKMVGRTPPNKGKPMSPEQRALLTEMRQDPEYRRIQSERFSGENNWNWKGGIKPELARRLDRADWRCIRLLCYERDNWMCADCNLKCLNTSDSKLYPKRKIQAHHIIPRRDGGSDDLSNLVTLCMSCHHKRERASL